MSDKIQLKCWLWERTPDRDDDNIKHDVMSDKVNMVSVPIKENELPCNANETHPPILDTLKARLSFKGNIRLSESGKSFNLFRDELEAGNDLVTLEMSSPF